MYPNEGEPKICIRNLIEYRSYSSDTFEMIVSLNLVALKFKSLDMIIQT